MQRLLDSYSGPAVIAQSEQRVDVMCSWEAVQDMVRAAGELLEGLKESYGSFSAPSHAPLTADEGQLVLPDGRTGAILITNIEIVSGQGSFRGNGAPPTKA